MSSALHSTKPTMPAPPARSRVLFEGRSLSARLSWYAPGLRMRRHEHACHQVSLLLAGTLGECGPGGEIRLDVPAVGVKPAGLTHANDYGPGGALILGINLDHGLDLRRDAGLASAWQWQAQPAAALLASARALLADLSTGADAEAGGDAEARVWELLAAMAGCGRMPVAGMAAGRPPRWVARACERLQEESTPLLELARQEGLHPVYFSRAFSRWTGSRPSAFRARARFQRALAALSAGQPLADAAQQAGFADQAHFSRAAREHSGLSPGQLRLLLA